MVTVARTLEIGIKPAFRVKKKTTLKDFLLKIM